MNRGVAACKEKLGGRSGCNRAGGPYFWSPGLVAVFASARSAVRTQFGFDEESAQAIVVLSFVLSAPPPFLGSQDKTPTKDPRRRPGLYTHGHPLPILACGNGYPDKPFSETMAELSRSGGGCVIGDLDRTPVPRHGDWGAFVYGATILREHGIGTDDPPGYGSERYASEPNCALRKQGLTVIPYAISFTVVEHLQDELIPNSKAIARNERTLHETLGLAWYWLHGWV